MMSCLTDPQCLCWHALTTLRPPELLTSLQEQPHKQRVPAFGHCTKTHSHPFKQATCSAVRPSESGVSTLARAVISRRATSNNPAPVSSQRERTAMGGKVKASLSITALSEIHISFRLKNMQQRSHLGGFNASSHQHISSGARSEECLI